MAYINKEKKILLIILLCFTAFSYAQKVVTGTVVDTNGIPLVGVHVIILNTTDSVTTDFDGNYTIEVGSATSLKFTYVGMADKIVNIDGKSSITVVLEELAKELGEVVITAMGITKEKKALGYAVQDLQGDVLEKVKSSDVMSSLAGRVAGLTIYNSTDFYQRPRISLRGSTPLIVINGVPDRDADIWKINSDDIANISVLKGAAASALYGSIGRNGAVMITTKRGTKGKLEVTFNNSTLFQPSFIRIPEVQTTYGIGDNGKYEYVDGSGAGIEGGTWIWGPRLDQKDPSTASGYWETKQYNSPKDKDGNLIPSPFISKGKDNVRNFFRTGLIQTDNLSIGWGNDKANYRMSFSNIYQRGIVPNTDLNNTSVSITGGLTPTDKFRLTGSITYNKQGSDNELSLGYGPNNYMYNLVLWTGADIDVREARDYWEEKGIQQKWYNIKYYNNPYFVAYEYLKGYYKSNVFGNIDLEYKITPDLSFKVLSGVNTYSTETSIKTPKSYLAYNNKSRGNYEIQNYNYFDITNNIGLKYDKEIGDISVKVELAYSNYFSNYKKMGLWTDGLKMPGIYNMSNNLGKTLGGNNLIRREGIHSFYGFADLSFWRSVYVSISGRNDEVSTLSKGNNMFFYPSISTSVVFSSLFKMPNWVSLAKLRGAISRVSEGKIGKDPYGFIQTYSSGRSWNGVPSSNFSNTDIPPDLKPQTSDTWEVGLDFRVLNNRLGLNATYYDINDYNNMTTVTISNASGYSSLLANGNTYRRRGVEFVLDGVPVKTKDFGWDAILNLSQYRRYQGEIYGNIEQLIKKGQRTDSKYITMYEKNKEGKIIFGDNGLPLNDPKPRLIGYDDPDWVFGLTNTITYKNYSLSFLLDGRLGGSMFSITNQKMWWGGTAQGTVNKYREDMTNGISSYIGDGVKIISGSVKRDSEGEIIEDTRIFAPNDKKVAYNVYMKETSNNIDMNYHWYDQTFVKLREVTITYQFPNSLLEKTFIKSANISLIGRNLLLFANMPNVDPDTGADNLQTPSTRNIGFNLNIKF